MKAPDKRLQPLYQRVVDDIAAQIQARAWQPGDKLPSEQALCERYGVSQITVRPALRELAHNGQVYSHHGLGWFVAQETMVAPTFSTTLLVPDMTWRVARLVRHLTDELAAAGGVLQLVFTEGQPDAEAKAIAQAAMRGASALIVGVGGPERGLAKRYTRLLANTHLPMILLYQEIPGLPVPAATLDEGQCMSEATRHLLSLNHRRIAYAGIDPALIEGEQRYHGFASTLWEQGLELPMDWVFSGELTSSPEMERFRAAFRDTFRPTALVCASDLRAAQALPLLQSLGLQCPEDVALVSLNDYDLAPFLPPPVTTVDPDIAGLAGAVARMVTELMAGHTVSSIHLSGALALRQSCGANARPPGY